MVALNESFAPENPSLGSKNRVGDFFANEAKSRRVNRLSVQNPRWEKAYDYDETASGMFFYGYRYYDAGTGRWLSKDTLGEAGGVNLFACVNNRLIDLFDFLGLFPQGNGSYGGFGNLNLRSAYGGHDNGGVSQGHIDTFNNVVDAVDTAAQFAVNEAASRIEGTVIDSLLTDVVPNVARGAAGMLVGEMLNPTSFGDATIPNNMRLPFLDGLTVDNERDGDPICEGSS